MVKVAAMIQQKPKRETMSGLQRGTIFIGLQSIGDQFDLRLWTITIRAFCVD
jgi:hypothetical protein